jgi:ABC-2 type transport system permease protein
VLGIAVLFIGFDKIVGFVTHDAPIDTSVLEPAIPFIVYFFVGMVATTAFTPSLEGKNFWIIQSLPIEMKNAYQGKMLFNMCLSVPFTVFSTLCFCISAKAAAAAIAAYFIAPLGFIPAARPRRIIRAMRFICSSEYVISPSKGAYFS